MVAPHKYVLALQLWLVACKTFLKKQVWQTVILIYELPTQMPSSVIWQHYTDTLSDCKDMSLCSRIEGVLFTQLTDFPLSPLSCLISPHSLFW